MKWNVMEEKLFAIFMVRVTAKAYNQIMTVSLVSSKLLVHLQSNLDC